MCYIRVLCCVSGVVVAVLLLAVVECECRCCIPVFFVLFFCVPQLYLWGSPLLGEIFAYVTVFQSNH